MALYSVAIFEKYTLPRPKTLWPLGQTGHTIALVPQQLFSGQIQKVTISCGTSAYTYTPGSQIGL
jgi:hypothetical protein